MKQFKRVIALIIAVVMMVSFASCSMIDETPVDITNDNIKIGVILKDSRDTSSGDTGYAMAAINDVLGLGYGIGEERFTTIESVNPDDEAAVSAALTEFVNKECNLVIATDNAYLDDIEKIAGGDNEDIKFFVLNAEDNGKNIYGYKADMTAAMYFTGLVAGMKAVALEMPKVGFVAANEENIELLNAFAMGVKAASADAKVAVAYGADAADKLIKDGCAVLASDYEDEAVAKAAADAKVFFCGFGSETYLNATNEETGEKLYESAFLCAPLYNYTQLYVNAIKAIVEEKEPETAFEGGYLEGIVYLSDLSEANVAEGTQEAVNAAVAAYADGSLEIKVDASAVLDNVNVIK